MSPGPWHVKSSDALGATLDASPGRDGSYASFVALVASGAAVAHLDMLGPCLPALTPVALTWVWEGAGEGECWVDYACDEDGNLEGYRLYPGGLPRL